jgi:hypothetical protein
MQTVTVRKAQVAGIALALLVAAFLTVQLSLAAFTDVATNVDNTFAAGEVEISESNAGTAMFDVTGIVPGWSETRQVTVTNGSSVDTEVALYLSDLADAGLAPYLTVSVTRDGDPLYDGGLAALPQTFETASVFAEAPSTVSLFEFTVALPTGQAGVNDAQGANVTASFTWEARSVSP